MEKYDELIAHLKKRVWESNSEADEEHYDGPPRPPLSVERVEEAEKLHGFRLPTLVRRLYLEVADGYWGPGYGLEPLFNVTPDFPRSLVGSMGAMKQIGWSRKLLPFCSWKNGINSYIEYDKPDLPIIYVDIDNNEERYVCWASGYSLEELLWAWLPEGDAGLRPMSENRPSSPPVDAPQTLEVSPILLKPEILSLLLSADDPSAFNEPYDFLFGYGNDAVKRVKNLVRILETITGATVHISGELNSSAFLELSVDWLDTMTETFDTSISLHFSTFGNLFTACEHWNSAKKSLPKPVVEQIIKAVSDGGFRYVDWGSLAAPYTGLHPEFQNWSWAFRYFSLQPSWRQPLSSDL